MTVDYDKITPGSLDSSDMTLIDPIKVGFFSTSGGSAGVGAPDACTGWVCSVCAMQKQVGEDKNGDHHGHHISKCCVLQQSFNIPIQCPTPP